MKRNMIDILSYAAYFGLGFLLGRHAVNEYFFKSDDYEEPETEEEPVEKTPEVTAKKMSDLQVVTYKKAIDPYRETHDDSDDILNEDAPFVIHPVEYGAIKYWDTDRLLFYSDGYLTDSNEVLINEPEKMIGLESLKHFGEYEENIVYVRNPRLRCDYEISCVNKKYIDLIEQKPYLETSIDELGDFKPINPAEEE